MEWHLSRAWNIAGTIAGMKCSNNEMNGIIRVISTDLVFIGIMLVFVIYMARKTRFCKN
ncbi:hypothetical protein [Herbinix luporum]|uniref:hypothetical protein n=1 Tax=Herbinix luporum TaxID=1679721 RepID=UPI0023F4662E|nr:hypothetical protein [Herbinix luporum]